MYISTSSGRLQNVVEVPGDNRRMSRPARRVLRSDSARHNHCFGRIVFECVGSLGGIDDRLLYVVDKRIARVHDI